MKVTKNLIFCHVLNNIGFEEYDHHFLVCLSPPYLPVFSFASYSFRTCTLSVFIVKEEKEWLLFGIFFAFLL
jgi:hypothetical protein